MNFIAILSRALIKPGEKPVELKKLSFEAPSITAAKSRVSKEANTLVFLEEVQSWDNAVRHTLGKDLRWKPWQTREPYTQDNGTKVGWSGKHSERFFGLATHTETDKFPTSPDYTAYCTLYWRLEA